MVVSIVTLVTLYGEFYNYAIIIVHLNFINIYSVNVYLRCKDTPCLRTSKISLLYFNKHSNILQ